MGRKRKEDQNEDKSFFLHDESIGTSKTLVTQSNDFIEAILQQSFKEVELKLLYLMSNYINNKKFASENIMLENTSKECMKVVISREEFCTKLKINEDHFYNYMDSDL